MIPNDTATAFLAAYNAHDWESAAALYAPDGRHYEAAMDKARTGRAELEAGLRGLASMLPDVAWRERERLLSGGHVLLRYDMTGTFLLRPEGETAPAPRRIELPGVLILTVADGRIVATADYWDKDAFLAQIR